MNTKRRTLLLSSSFVIFSLCLTNCEEQPTVGKDFYSFSDWNRSLMDSIIISFSIDSVFKPKPYDWNCFDEGNPCRIFGNDDCTIIVNYDTYPNKGNFESLTARGEIKTNQIRDAYPGQRITPPKIIKLGMLEGVMVESSGLNFQLLNYAGYNKEMYASFDIKVKSNDTTLNVKNILLPLIKSISIQKKE